MSNKWYYVSGHKKMGPVPKDEILSLMAQRKLDDKSYVWRKGFSNWSSIKNVKELAAEGPPSPGLNWDHVTPQEKIISIKIGYDRGTPEAEYGPFSLEQLSQAFEEKRINEKTFVYAPGMEKWTFLGDTPLFEKFSGGMPPQIEEQDRRFGPRRPFVAKIFFTDNDSVYEGICRDISIGGLQILVADFPGDVGDKVNMNVHPDNSESSFVASGKIVRSLEGGSGFSLRFEDLNDEAIYAIKSYLAQS